MGFKINGLFKNQIDQAKSKAKVSFQNSGMMKAYNHHVGVAKSVTSISNFKRNAYNAGAHYTPLSKSHSKTVVNNVYKKVFNASGIMQTIEGKNRKKQRDRDLAKMKKFGIPPAPNGEAYEQNDVDYLLKQGYSKEAAIATLSKEKKYTEKIDYAPNGAVYEENDIKYLMDKEKYTKEQAIAYLAKCTKYQKATYATIKQAAKSEISNAAQTFVNNQLDEMLNVKIDEIAAKYGISTKWDDETKQKVRDIIRGHCDVTFANDKIIKNAIAKTSKEIERFFDKKIIGNVNNSANKAIKSMDRFASKIQKLDERRLKMSPEEFSEKFTQSLNHLLNHASPVNKLTKKAKQLDSLGQAFGVDLGLERQMKPVIGNVAGNISKSLSGKLYPKFTQKLKVTSKLTGSINKYKGYIKDRQKFVTERAAQWKKQAQEKIAAQEKKLITSALGSLKGVAKSFVKIKF